MIAWVANVLRRAWFPALLVGLTAGTALAQSGAPIRLQPLPPPVPVAPAPQPTSPSGDPPPARIPNAPSSEAPVDPARPPSTPPPAVLPAVAPPTPTIPPAPPATAAPATTALPPVPSGFQVNPLQAIDIDTIGVLTGDTEGLGLAMWSGTPRPAAERLIDLLPLAPATRTLRDLQRRLLQTTAEVPEGPASGPRLLLRRAEKLLAMGHVGDAASLLQFLPQRIGDPTLERLRYQARLLVGDTAAACDDVRRNLATREEIWQRGQTMCLIAAGDIGKADLQARLLSEQGFADDPIFSLLIDAVVAGTRLRVPPTSSPEPLHVVLAQVGKLSMPTEWANLRQAGVANAVARSGRTDMRQRLAIAETLERGGAWSADDLAKLYAEVDVPAENLANPFSAAERDPGRSWAILYQAAKRQEQPLARAQVLDQALALAETKGSLPTQSRVLAPMIAAMEPMPALGFFARRAARALLIAGDVAAAGRWLESIRTEAPRSPTFRGIDVSLWPLARIAGGDALTAWKADGVALWAAEQKEAEGTHQRRVRALVLMSALGDPVDAKVWRDLIIGTERSPLAYPSPALSPAIDDAVAGRRIAESVALMSIAFGDTSIGELPLPLVTSTIDALNRLGMKGEARALAREAAIAGGL